MKKFILIFLLCFSLFTSNIFSQSGWIKSYAGYYNLGIHFYNQNTGYLIDETKLYKSTNGGINWTNLFTLEYTYNSSSGYYFDENNYVLTGSTSNHIYGWIGVCNDGVRSDYYIVPSTLMNYTVFTTTYWINKDTGFIGGYELNATMSDYDGRLLRTTNRGVNWTDVITPTLTEYVTCIKFLNANTGYILKPYLEKTTNMGNNWTRLIDSSNMGEICIVNTDTIYISSGTGRVKISTNGGLTWNIRNIGYNIGICRLRFINSKTGWALSSSGTTILKTTNAGVNWQLQTHNNSGITLRDLYILDENYLWAVGDSNSTKGIVFRTTTGGALFVNQTGTETPINYKLEQNYPNPFNPKTNIKFDIAKSEFVTLKVYNILGKEIETLVNDKLSSGSYEVKWDASQYPSGIYFYNLQAGNFSETKKMTLIK